MIQLIMLIFIAAQFWEKEKPVKPIKIECLEYNIFDNKCEVWDND